MKFAKIGIVIGLTLMASPAFAAGEIAGLTCAEAHAVHESAFTRVVQQYGDEVERGNAGAAAAFLNGDLLAVAPSGLSQSKAQLDSIEAHLVSKGCPSAPGWKGDWTRL